MNTRLSISFLLCLALWVPVDARAASLEGQRFEDAVRLANTEMLLNGLGLRGVIFIKGYVAGLYLPTRGSTYLDIAALPGPKRLQLRMLRATAPEAFIDALVGGMRKNSSEAELQQLDERIGQLSSAIQSGGAAKVGDVVNFDYLPEQGTVLTMNGKLLGQAISGADFYNAVLRIFIGEHPVDKKLKQGLLGGSK
ncbi:MAG: chalcone isomerase family protein [Rhodoferax sp.]|nr:chalcone isomerase family protein [Rhodoferax sp.]